jgi:hypothetical protein
MSLEIWGWWIDVEDHKDPAIVRRSNMQNLRRTKLGEEWKPSRSEEVSDSFVSQGGGR